jgi:hypothetical protein
MRAVNARGEKKSLALIKQGLNCIANGNLQGLIDNFSLAIETDQFLEESFARANENTYNEAIIALKEALCRNISISINTLDAKCHQNKPVSNDFPALIKQLVNDLRDNKTIIKIEI